MMNKKQSRICTHQYQSPIHHVVYIMRNQVSCGLALAFFVITLYLLLVHASWQLCAISGVISCVFSVITLTTPEPESDRFLLLDTQEQYHQEKRDTNE